MRLTLEESMVRGDRFTGAEVAELLEHPLLKPRIGQLVFVDDAGKLAWAAEMTRTKGELRIAHPVDLLASGDWSRWQQACFAEAHLQPFKQIFRELYVLTEAEKQQGQRSRRYEGQQVNPKQAIALLGTRGWVSVPEDGVRRTFHREGLSAYVEFLEGFMTPAEVDGLTVTHVVFATTRRLRPIDLVEVPPRIFSEAMRDLDLVVSVAHRGGVDPEASASTVEMRGVAASRDLLAAGDQERTRARNSTQFIDGNSRNYSVHLGSAHGPPHPGGAICIVARALRSIADGCSCRSPTTIPRRPRCCEGAAAGAKDERDSGSDDSGAVAGIRAVRRHTAPLQSRLSLRVHV